MREQEHRFRVRYPEVDRMNIAHHTAYLVWFELGRTELLRETGLAYRSLEEERGLLFPLLEVAVRYHAPARYDEELAVCTTLDPIAGVRVRFGYRIIRPGQPQPLASGHTVHAATDTQGRPRRMPADVKEILDAWQRG